MPLFGQSLMKGSLIYAGTASSSGLNGNPDFGFSLGHQHHLFSRTKFKVLMTENLEYKKAGFSYNLGGRGGGTSTKGDINFVNIKVDARARIGKDFFFDVGIYTSYALLNSISNGQAIFTQSCYSTGPNQSICPEPKNQTVVNEFSNFDYGILYGVGFRYRKIIVNLDIQGGLANVVDFLYSKVTLQQVNLSVAFPISFTKKEEVK
jgi:Outer membrane protein beta-barrel domain